MINYFNLIRALQTDQYDEFTVKDLKEEFNTEPDIDTTYVNMFPEGREKFDKKIAGLSAYFGVRLPKGAVIVIGSAVDDPFPQIPSIPFPIKNLNIEPLAQAAQIFESPKSLRKQKQQNQFRSRNFKK